MRTNCVFVLSILLCIIGISSCNEYDDGIDMHPYEFSENNVVVDSKATDLSITIKNANKWGTHWSIIGAFVIDENGNRKDIDNDWIVDPSSEYGNKMLSPVFQKEWFKISYADEGHTLKVHADENEGGERKLIISICSIEGEGIFYLTQKAGNNEKAN